MNKNVLRLSFIISGFLFVSCTVSSRQLAGTWIYHSTKEIRSYYYFKSHPDKLVFDSTENFTAFYSDSQYALYKREFKDSLNANPIKGKYHLKSNPASDLWMPRTYIFMRPGMNNRNIRIKDSTLILNEVGHSIAPEMTSFRIKDTYSIWHVLEDCLTVNQIVINTCD